MPEIQYEQDCLVSQFIHSQRLLQAFGSHAIVDDEFDDIFELDLVDHNGRFNHLLEMTDVR